jgi:hypothetical protein
MITKIEGLDEFNAYLKNATPETKEAITHELKIIATDLQGKAQRLAPVDVGDLRGSGFSEVDGLDATVGFTEPYALRQHEELDYAHPRGGQAKYLETPYKENLNKYKNALADAIREAVDK